MKQQIRTDLAVESVEQLKEKSGSPGVRQRQYEKEGVTVTEVVVQDESTAQKLQKPIGSYITIDLSLIHILNFSLWATPKRCSSSTMASPSDLNSMSFCTSRWVPTTISTSPVLSFFTVSRCCLGERNRESSSMFAGTPSNRLRMFW